MTPQPQAACIVHRAILAANTYERLCAAEALLKNFRRLYNCQAGERDYCALLVVVDNVREKLAEQERKHLTRFSIRYRDEE